MIQVVDQYPGDAAAGGCYISRSSRGEIVEIDPVTGEDRVRPERVIVTSVDLDFEGRLCFGERTIRHCAHLLGMVDGWRAERLRREHESYVEVAQQTARDLEDARVQIDVLRAMIDDGRPTAYVATDGSVWPTARAAQEESRRLAGLAPSGADGLRSIGADEAPLPSGEKARV